MRHHRVAISFVGVAMLGAGAFGVACSARESHGFSNEEDSGVDATAMPEASRGDTATADAPVVDVAPPPDAGGPDVTGACSPVNTACDIVRQNCPSGHECVAASDTATACQAIRASQHLPKGHTCCPSAPQAQCAPGLRCIGPDTPCQADAGAFPGRCTPACCDDDICGKSDPEGFAGRCQLSIVGQSEQELYKVCDYSPPCKPFHVQSCPQNFTCNVDDKFGTASCVGIYAPIDGGTIPSGYAEGTACSTLNSCADGLACVSRGDAGSTCTWLCLTPGENPPFDAGALRDAGAGYGGCPNGERCILTFAPTDLPVWISACAP